MAREVILAFKTKFLEKAEKIAQDVQVILKETKQTSAEVSADTKDAARDLKRRARETAKEAKKKERILSRLGRSAERVRGRGPAGISAVKRTTQDLFAKLGESREKINTGIAIGTSGLTKMAGISTLIPSALMASSIMIVVAPLFDAFMTRMNERFETEQQRQSDHTAALVERMLAEADHGRRMQDDPVYRRGQAQLAFNAQRAEQREMARRGLCPSASFLERF